MLAVHYIFTYKIQTDIQMRMGINVNYGQLEIKVSEFIFFMWICIYPEDIMDIHIHIMDSNELSNKFFI